MLPQKKARQVRIRLNSLFLLKSLNASELMIKLILIIFTACSSLLANAQKYALLDKDLKLPILYTDSISVQQIKQGYFPIEKEKIDSFLANLNYISNLLNERTRSKMGGVLI